MSSSTNQVNKKLVNDTSRCVEDCLEGFVAVNPGVQILEGHRVVIRSDIEEVKAAGKVTVLSGGGSGHEPAHAGYVGPGMLSGAIAGAVFTSPPPGSILAAIRTVGKGNAAGTLLIIKNYTGDRLNFGNAVERAKAEGLKVDMVVVAEDCALTSADRTAGRRGLCGVMFIHKIAGAMADQGKSLEEIVRVTKAAALQMGTVGLSLSPCSVPGSGPSFTLGVDEMELGLGIHGEAGVRRMKVLPSAQSVAAVLEHLTNPQSSTHLNVPKGSSVSLLVNNLGGTSILELNIVARDAILWLEQKGVNVERVYCGSLVTSLEMAGISLSLMHLDDNLRNCLDAPVGPTAWPKPLLPAGVATRVTPKTMPCPEASILPEQNLTGRKVDNATAQLLYKMVESACQALGRHETQLNDLDRQSGDGDCGSTHKRGSDAILKKLGSIESPGLPVNCPQALLLSLASIVEQDMGGSSGAIYSLFFSAAAVPLAEATSPEAWGKAFQAGIEAAIRYGGAQPGDRTMLDALQPACQTLVEKTKNQSPLEALSEAVRAAEEGAASTASMQAHAGRASYVSVEHLTQPDPGAHAVGIWLRGAYEAAKLVVKS